MIQFHPILAQTQSMNRLEGLRSAFNNRESKAMDIRSILVFFAILAAVILVVGVVHHLRQSRAAPRQPTRLFNQVMKRLGVGFADRVMMRFLVGRCSLEHPTVLFFNREFFDRQAGQWVDSISIKPLQDCARARIAAIAELAFSTDDPPVTPADAQA